MCFTEVLSYLIKSVLLYVYMICAWVRADICREICGVILEESFLSFPMHGILGLTKAYMTGAVTIELPCQSPICF